MPGTVLGAKNSEEKPRSLSSWRKKQMQKWKRMSAHKRAMAEKCRVCPECGQQAAVREGFLEDLLFKQISGVKGGLRPLTLACKANYIHFFPVLHLVSQLVTWNQQWFEYSHLRNQQALQTKFFPPGEMVVKSFPTNPWVECSQDRGKHISGKVHTIQAKTWRRGGIKQRGIHDFNFYRL